MKTFLIVVICITIGLAIGYPMGRAQGIEVGAEWAMIQAQLTAKDAGINMPVSYRNGEFKVILKQPRKFYSTAYQLAKKDDQVYILASVRK